MLLHLPLLLALSAAVSEGATFGNQAYDGQKLAAVHVESLQQIGAVEQLVSDVLGIQRRAENDNTHMVHVRGLAEDLDGLREHGFEVDILSDSVADYIADAEAVEVCACVRNMYECACVINERWSKKNNQRQTKKQEVVYQMVF